MTSRADALLSGPRGRRLCLALVTRPPALSWPALTWVGGAAGHPAGRFDPAQLRASLAAAVAATDLDAVGLPERSDAALLESVDSARYWQEADDADQLLTDPSLAELLAPVAEAVVAAPRTGWWAEPLDRDRQHTISWPTGEPPEHRAPVPADVDRALRQWRETTLAEEQRAARERPADPRANWSGSWWSTPALSGAVTSSRARPDDPVSRRGVRVPIPVPVGLTLVEDELGWPTARTWPVRVRADARVYEVDGPAAWTALVERHPLEVSASRRHDWYRVSGEDGAWVVPDWAGVADQYDAVHLTVDGYLSTAGRALPVARGGAPARTVLAGWHPDATWWLTDVLAVGGEPVDWVREDDEPPRWSPV